MTVSDLSIALDPATVRRTTLPNGLRVLVRRDPSAPVVAIVTYVSAGYFDETDDVVGIAHVLEHMYFKGTPTRGVGEIARQTKAVGGYLNAATIYDHTSYYTVLPASSFAAGLDVQFDAYANSLIDSAELARELEVIIQEAKRKEDNPGAVATETLFELLHDRHRIRRWRIGREAGLRKLDRDAMTTFYRNFYHPGNTVLVVVGDVDPGEALREITARYGALPAGTPVRVPGPMEEGVAGFRYREWTGDVGQTQLAFGWRTPATLDPATPGLEVLSTVLGAGRASRLYRAVREQKLASSVSAYDYTPTSLGVFVVHAEAPPERAAEAAQAIWAQLRDVRDNGVSDAELLRARRVYESRWVRRLEDMEGQANYLAEWEALGSWELGERHFERMLSTPADAIVAVMRRYITEDRAALLAYRPRSAPEVAPDAESLRARLRDARKDPLAPSNAIEVGQNGGAPRAITKERVEAGVHVYRLASGVPVLVRPRPGSLITYMGVFALGGASAETLDTAGRTLLMARTALKGTSRRTAVQIAEAGEMLGGSVGAAVGGETLGWSISVPAAHAAAAMELLADVAQHPTFEDSALETERAIALSDLATLEDDMYRYPMRLAVMAAFAGHPYGVPALGTDASLRSHTPADLRAWHRDHFLHAPNVIGIVGGDDPDAMAGMVARHFGELTHAPAPVLAVPAWTRQPVVAVERREKAQTALVLTWAGPARNDDARYDFAMLAGVASGLGGRLFEELRDKQSLCYTVQAFPSERRVAGTFNAYIATSPEKEDAARAGLLLELGKLRDDLVAHDELLRAQTYAIGVHQIRQQSGGAVLGEIADAWLFGTLAELEQHEAKVRAVTSSGIRATAQRYLDPERRVEGIVRGVGKHV